MSDTAQLYQKLLNDAIRKQITILGKQITLIKVRNVTGLTVTDDGTVGTLASNQEAVVTRFLEEFRELSSPLVKKTMQPLLSAIGTTLAQATTPTPAQTPPQSPGQKPETQTEGIKQEAKAAQ